MSPHRPDDGGSKDLWNVGKLLPDYTALQPRRQPSSYSPPWEPQILLRSSVKSYEGFLKPGLSCSRFESVTDHEVFGSSSAVTNRRNFWSSYYWNRRLLKTKYLHSAVKHFKLGRAQRSYIKICCQNAQTAYIGRHHLSSKSLTVWSHCKAAA
jgi:hypothetical protein